MTPWNIQLSFPDFGASLDEKERFAIELLREHEQAALALDPNGFYLATSGGKDSIVLEELARRAGVRHQAVVNVTTIDPPELVRFNKARASQARIQFNIPARNFFVAMWQSHGLPTRLIRWCCEEFKERSGDGRVKLLGVRKSESARRRKAWELVTPWRNDVAGGYAVCPIVHWSDQDVWGYIHYWKLPYPTLYDEGWRRLGCVGCPMAGKQRHAEFARWPGFEKAWRWGCRKYFNARKGNLNRLNQPYYLERFRTSDELFEWWLSDNPTPKEDDQECLGLYEEPAL